MKILYNLCFSSWFLNKLKFLFYKNAGSLKKCEKLFSAKFIKNAIFKFKKASGCHF